MSMLLYACCNVVVCCLEASLSRVFLVHAKKRLDRALSVTDRAPTWVTKEIRRLVNGTSDGVV